MTFEILHETFKKGLNNSNDFLIDKLSVVGNSFLAFQIRFVAQENTVIVPQNNEFDLPNDEFQICSLQISSAYSFKVLGELAVNGFNDALIPKTAYFAKSGEEIILYAYAEVKTAVNDQIEVKLLSCKNEVVACRTLLVEALSYTLPKPQDYSCKIDLWQHNCCIARYYGLQNYSEEHFAIIENYISVLAALGQKSVTLILSDKPWDGQRKQFRGRFYANMFEYQMPKVFCRNGEYRYDFSVVDRYIELCEKYGIAEEYEVFGLCGVWSEDLLVKCYDEIKNKYFYLGKDGIELFIQEVYKHFKKKHYIEKTLICADEPQDIQRFRNDLMRIRRLAPEFKFKAALDNLNLVDEFKNDLAVIVPSFFTTCRKFAALSELPIEKTWYICCGPENPNTFLKSNLIEARALAYLNRVFGFNGFLRWAFTAWSDAPYADARVGEWHAGDTSLVYPGNIGNPVLSLRYMSLRRAMEDVQILSDFNVNDVVFNTVIYNDKPETYTFHESEVANNIYSMKFADYEEARKRIINESTTNR